MSVLVADTHCVVWYLSEPHRLSIAAHDAMQAATRGGDRIILASITLVEVAYLVEKGRIDPAAFEKIADSLADSSGTFALCPLDLAVAEALRRIPRDHIPDMPDRIVAATALHLNAPLVTADRMIRNSGVATIW